jgi:hypothetical protein
MADAKIKLKEHDNWTFDNIILMAPSVKGKNWIGDNLFRECC